MVTPSPPPVLVDTHAHLASPRFANELPDLVARAREAGVTRIVAIGTNLDDSRRNLELARQFQGTVSATVGVHPTDAPDVLATTPGWLDQLRQLAAHPAVVAIGEIGTDHFHPPPKGLDAARYHALQAEAFTRQLELAVLLGKNVVIHQRESFGETVRLLAPFGGKLRAVFHCFTGTWDDAAPLVADGHLVSFTGIATFRSAADVQACARHAPADAFMLETDAPFLAPVPHRGKRNEPAFVRPLAEHVAALRGQPLDDLARDTSATAERFFSLTPAAK